VLNRQDEQARILEDIRNRLYSRTLERSTVSARPSPAVDNPSSTGSNSSFTSSNLSGHRDNFDNASIISKRSTFSLRLGWPTYLEDLKASRAYKRLRHFGLGIDSSSNSVFSFDSAYSTGNWSILSDITLGDLSVSQIAVLNLPIGLLDVCNPEPFKEPSSTEAQRSHIQSKKSSRGRIHNAIETGNGFFVRSLLAMGTDVEELDSSGRTPLIHALEKQHVAICKILVEKGASIAQGASDTRCK